MQITNFKTHVPENSLTPHLSFCVNISTDELTLFNSNLINSVIDERERAFGKMLLEQIISERIKELKGSQSSLCDL